MILSLGTILVVGQEFIMCNHLFWEAKCIKNHSICHGWIKQNQQKGIFTPASFGAQRIVSVAPHWAVEHTSNTSHVMTCHNKHITGFVTLTGVKILLTLLMYCCYLLSKMYLQCLDSNKLGVVIPDSHLVVPSPPVLEPVLEEQHMQWCSAWWVCARGCPPCFQAFSHVRQWASMCWWW